MNVLNRRKSSSLVSSSLKKSRPKETVNFYTEIPECAVSIDEFEELALARLKVLRKVEQLRIRNVDSATRHRELNEIVKKELPNDHMDHVSHFILRAAYSRSEDLRKWFLMHETALLRHRLETWGVSKDGAVWPTVNADEFAEQLQFNLSPTELVSQPIYKIPFTEAVELVASRSCFVHQGYAYCPQSRLLPVIVGRFRQRLSKTLVMSHKIQLGQAKDPRLERLLETLHKQDATIQDAPTDAGVLTASNVTKMVRHMPLCMSQLQAGLQKDGKLKHWGRLQYGLFLKTAGLSLEDSLLFFEKQFTATTSFGKEYAYNIRHMYGQEGSRKTYKGYPCSKIIHNNAPGSGDHHGCPFHHYDVPHLTAALKKVGIHNPKPILDQKANPQVACQEHFKLLHPNATQTSGVGDHPNLWFNASLEYANQHGSKDDDSK